MRIRDYFAGKTNGYGTSPPTLAECEECNHGKGNWDETDWSSVSDNRKAAKARRKGGNA